MARQALGAKKVHKYRQLTGFDVIAGLVRGDTNHRVDLCLRDGSVAYLWADGRFEMTDMKHQQPNVLESKPG